MNKKENGISVLDEYKFDKAKTISFQVSIVNHSRHWIIQTLLARLGPVNLNVVFSDSIVVK